MVHIITDSAADFEPGELTELNITCIPSIVMFGVREYRENINLSKEQFYELLTTDSEFPRTAQPSPAEYEQLLENFRDQGDEAVFITLSSAFSGLYQNVMLMKETLRYENCHVVDSLTVAGGQRIMVEQAVRLRDEGRSAGEIASELEKLRGRIEVYACLGTLEYVYRGGRISRTAYALGTISNVKPVVHVTSGGQAEIAAKMLGMSRGINYMKSRLLHREPDLSYPIYVMYTCDRENAEALARSIKKAGFDIPDEQIINVGATIGSHVGINGCGLVYVAKNNS